MMRSLLALVFILFPSVVVSQTVVIRSGEHDGYTRLVFDFDRRIEWSVKEIPSGAELSFSDGPFRFDDGAVFKRISRGRLQRLRPASSGKTIILDLACDCTVNGFWHGTSMLVLDISGRENTRLEIAKRAPGSANENRAGALLALPARGGSSAATLSLNLPDPAGSPPVSQDPNPAPDPDDFALEGVRDELIRQFGRAASQGLLKPNTSLPGSASRGEAPRDAPTEPPDNTIVDTPETGSQEPALQIRARSSMDSAFVDVLNERGMALSGTPSCIDPALVDVENWASDAAFWQQVSERRSVLTGEFDRVSDDALLALARLYVHFGFGLEARQVLAMAPVDTLQHRTVLALADIMDHEHDSFGSPLHGQFDCDGRTALWSALAHETLPSDQRLDTDEIITAFSSLPKHLRSHLGPTLSDRFRGAGLIDASERVLRILNRTPDTTTPRSELIVAETERAAGQDENADNRLEKIARTNSESAVTALIEMVESLVQREKPVSYDMAQLAGAYAFEHRDGANAAQLQRAHVLALAAAGAFDEAYATLDTLEEAPTTDLRPLLAEILTREAPDIVFLKHVLAGRVGPYDALGDPVALSIASRLFEAGFLDAADKALEDPRHSPNSREARVLRAEIALAQGLPRKAEVELLGLDGNDVNILRARSRSLAGEHEQAYELYRTAGLAEDAEREAWFAAAPDVRMAEPVLDESTRILARNRDLLEASSAVRSDLSSLLSANPVPTLEN